MKFAITTQEALQAVQRFYPPKVNLEPVRYYDTAGDRMQRYTIGTREAAEMLCMTIPQVQSFCIRANDPLPHCITKKPDKHGQQGRYFDPAEVTAWLDNQLR